MKQLLELVIMDDGTLDLKCHNEELANNYFSKKPKVFDKQLKRLISKMVKIMWGEKKTGISRLIRVLSMAEMCAGAEPYVQAEEFWSNMMFSLIPRVESFANGEKRKYSDYCGAKERPITFVNASAFNLDYRFKNKN